MAPRCGCGCERIPIASDKQLKDEEQGWREKGWDVDNYYRWGI